MKYYKCLNNGNATIPQPWEIGKIYPEDSHPDKFFINTKDSFKAHPSRWKEVEESEYLLQIAKEKYPVGTVFYSAEFKSKHVSNGNFEYYRETNFESVSTGGRHIYSKNRNENPKWAEIISKPEEITKEEFILPDKWCVKVSSQNRNILDEWRKQQSGYKEGKKLVFYLVNDRCYDNSYCSYTCNLPSEGKYKEITFEQFENYVLKNKTMGNKRIIGYRLIKPEYESAVTSLTGLSNFPTFQYYGEFEAYQRYDLVRDKLKDAGVLDLWFEPVFGEDKPDIKIKGYKAEISDNQVVFGCQIYSKEFVLQLAKCLEQNDFKMDNKDEILKLAKYYESR
jgi:hypothetical protein